MYQNQYDADFAGRLKLKVQAVPTLKGHKSLNSESDCCVGIMCMNIF